MLLISDDSAESIYSINFAVDNFDGIFKFCEGKRFQRVDDLAKRIRNGGLAKWSRRVGGLTKRLRVGGFAKRLRIGGLAKRLQVGGFAKRLRIGGFAKRLRIGGFAKRVEYHIAFREASERSWGRLIRKINFIT